MSEFSDLSLFTQIAKLGSMAAAAQELGVSPPVISRRLAALEERLGARLLYRTTRRLSLTPEGELYLNDGARILEQITALEHRIGGGSSQPQGTIRIGATLGFGRLYIAPQLSKFAESYPDVEVQLNLSEKPHNLVEQGLDLVIRFGDLADSRLTARLLANNRRILCAAPSYIKRFGAPASPRDLGKHNCIFIREGDETFGTWYLRRGNDVDAVKVRANLSSNDGTAALAWAVEGRGILLRSQWDIADLLRKKKLAPILTDWASPSADIYAVFQATRHMPAKIRTLVDALVDAFEPWRRRGNEIYGPW